MGARVDLAKLGSRRPDDPPGVPQVIGSHAAGYALRNHDGHRYFSDPVQVATTIERRKERTSGACAPQRAAVTYVVGVGPPGSQDWHLRIHAQEEAGEALRVHGATVGTGR